MGKLYFELDDIDIESSDKMFFNMLSKFYYSQKLSKVYDDVLAYNIAKLTDSKKSIFVNLARSAFEYGETKKDISSIVANDTFVYTIPDLISGNF